MDLAMVEFQPTSSRFYQNLSQTLHIDGLSEARISQSTFNGAYVEEALIYRLSAA